MKFFKRDRTIISLEFGSKRIKLAEGKIGKAFQVKNIASIGLSQGTYDDGNILNMDKLKEAIYNLMKDENIKSEDIVIVSNSSEIITREVSIPKVDYQEIKGLLTFQMDDLFPVDPTNYIIDYLILGETLVDNVDRIDLFLLGIPKSMVESHFKLITDLEFNPIAMDYQGNAIRKLFLKSKSLYGKALKDKTLVAIDLGYRNIKVNIITNGQIEVTRNLNVGISEVYKNISEILNLQPEDIKNIMDKIGTRSEEFKEDYDIERIENMIKTNFEIIFDKLDLIFLYYKSRNSSNNIDLITLQGGIVYNDYILDLFSDYFNIDTYILNELDFIEDDVDLSQYGNVIGGLIRLEEV